MLTALDSGRFVITVEVVPPAGPDPEPILRALESLAPLPVEGFSVASNPVARPRMSALALSALAQKRTGRTAILHCTTRDHNRLSLQGLLWGARALGIDTVMAATGDFVALGERVRTSSVDDLDVYGLIGAAREAGLATGVVFDPSVGSEGLERAARRLGHKVKAGAQFAVTQPVYDEAGALALAEATRSAGIPILMGILPLRSPRHAEFLHTKVAGIEVPSLVRERMARASDPIAEGVAGAREVLSLARRYFAGACLMPPFDHYEILGDIVTP